MFSITYNVCEREKGLITEFCIGGRGGGGDTRGRVGIRRVRTPPVRSAEAITHSKLRKCL